jgi:hypothetical protein
MSNDRHQRFNRGRSRGTRPRRPAVEGLEGRSLQSGGVSRSFLFTPIPEGTPLAEHIHPHLTIIIGGVRQVIPAGIGLGPSGALPIHTHTSDGTLHVESTKRLPFTLGDFFRIWGPPFSRTNLLGHHATPGDPIRMTVDGRPSHAFGSLLLHDQQQIIIQM